MQKLNLNLIYINLHLFDNAMGHCRINAIHKLTNSANYKEDSVVIRPLSTQHSYYPRSWPKRKTTKLSMLYYLMPQKLSMLSGTMAYS